MRKTSNKPGSRRVKGGKTHLLRILKIRSQKLRCLRGKMIHDFRHISFAQSSIGARATSDQPCSLYLSVHFNSQLNLPAHETALSTGDPSQIYSSSPVDQSI